MNLKVDPLRTRVVEVRRITPARTRTVTRAVTAPLENSTTRLGPTPSRYENRPFASVLTDAGRRELVTPITRSDTATGAFATARPAASASVPSTTARSPYFDVRTTARDFPLNHARTRGATSASEAARRSAAGQERP